MAFRMQRLIEELYTGLGRETVRKARKYIEDGGTDVNRILSKNTEIPPYYFSKGPEGVFLMREPESESSIMIGYGDRVYALPNLFLDGTLGVYGETMKGERLIGIKPKYVEGPYNREKLAEYKQAVYTAKLLLKKVKSDPMAKKFLQDYIRIGNEEIRLMKNPKRTLRYVSVHENTHRALADIGVAKKIDTYTNEGITENVAEDVAGYSLLSPKALYTTLKNRIKSKYGGKSGVYRKIKHLSDVPAFGMV